MRFSQNPHPNSHYGLWICETMHYQSILCQFYKNFHFHFFFCLFRVWNELFHYYFWLDVNSVETPFLLFNIYNQKTPIPSRLSHYLFICTGLFFFVYILLGQFNIFHVLVVHSIWVTTRLKPIILWFVISLSTEISV